MFFIYLFSTNFCFTSDEVEFHGNYVNLINDTKNNTLMISDNDITVLSGDLVPKANVIAEFRASENNLSLIEHKLIRRLKDSQVIDFTANKCTDNIYERDSEKSLNINSFHSAIYFACADEDD